MNKFDVSSDKQYVNLMVQASEQYTHISCDDPQTIQTEPGHYITVPCSTCERCIKIKRWKWVGRINAELKCYPPGSAQFVTLTYANEPKDFIYRDVQNYLKVLRNWRIKRLKQIVSLLNRRSTNHSKRQYLKKLKMILDLPLRYFVVGERGDRYGRIHWHIILFGMPPAEQLRDFSLQQWKFGMVHSDELTPARIMYCASYCLKKQKGASPYVVHMSLKPAIGTMFMRLIGKLAHQAGKSESELETARYHINGNLYPMDRTMRRTALESFYQHGGQSNKPLLSHHLPQNLSAETMKFWESAEIQMRASRFRDQVALQNERDKSVVNLRGTGLPGAS